VVLTFGVVVAVPLDVGIDVDIEVKVGEVGVNTDVDVVEDVVQEAKIIVVTTRQVTIVRIFPFFIFTPFN
jgi:hypothetical protein